MDRILIASFVLISAIAAVQGLVLFAALWAVGQANLRWSPDAQALVTEDGPDIHEEMPTVEGTDLNGQRIASDDYPGRELVILFVSPSCGPCEGLLRCLGRTARTLRRPVEYLVVLEATPETAAECLRRNRLKLPTIIDETAAIRGSLGVSRTPFAFLVDTRGVVRMKGVVNDRAQLEGLIMRRGRYGPPPVWREIQRSSEPTTQ